MVVISIVVPKGSETLLSMCLNVPPDFVTLKSTVTSALLPLTLDNKIPIKVVLTEKVNKGIDVMDDLKETIKN